MKLKNMTQLHEDNRSLHGFCPYWVISPILFVFRTYLYIVRVDIVTIVAGGEVDDCEGDNADDEDWSQHLQCKSPVPAGKGKTDSHFLNFHC